MSGSRSANRNSSRPPENGAPPRGRYSRLLGLSLGSAAVFAVLFYLWGRELFPRAAGRWGGTFPFVGAVALTLAVALFLSEWFGFAGREVRKVRLAARDFLFLCSLALLLFFAAKAVIDLLAEIPALGRGVPTRVYAYLIPLPAFAMVVRVLINSETSILFTVAASVLSAAAASGSWPALLLPPPVRDRRRRARPPGAGPVQDAAGRRADRARVRPRGGGPRVLLPRRRGSAVGRDLRRRQRPPVRSDRPRGHAGGGVRLRLRERHPPDGAVRHRATRSSPA